MYSIAFQGHMNLPDENPMLTEKRLWFSFYIDLGVIVSEKFINNSSSVTLLLKELIICLTRLPESLLTVQNLLHTDII